MKRDEVAAAYDAAAEGYDDRHAAGAAMRRRTAVVDGIQLAAVRGARRVLELGCGTGRLLARVAAPVRIGVDVSPEMLRRSAARGLAVARADGNQLPFASATFDGVIAGKGVFRYLDPDLAFAECARVLAPGGVLALHQYGNRTISLRGRARPEPGLWELGSVDALEAPARRAGLVVRAIHLFRPIRIPPYFLAIPRGIDRLSPFQLWAHCVAVLVAPS